MTPLLVACLALAPLSPPPAAPAPVEVADYLLVFAADGMPYRPTKAHTFAAVVRVETAAGCPPKVADVRSLSWLPVAGTIRAFALTAETGRNVPLDETLSDAVAAGRRLDAWGPFRVTPEFADRFRERVATVETSFRYKAACFTSPKRVCDCARSIEEMVGPRRLIGFYGYGSAAASHIVRLFTPWLVEPDRTHPWVAEAIGLGAYPVTYHGYGDFTERRDQMRAARR